MLFAKSTKNCKRFFVIIEIIFVTLIFVSICGQAVGCVNEAGVEQRRTTRAAADDHSGASSRAQVNHNSHPIWRIDDNFVGATLAIIFRFSFIACMSLQPKQAQVTERRSKSHHTV